MAKYTVKLPDGDPFRETFRTFEGFREHFTVNPIVVELTDEQRQALAVNGLVIEPVDQASPPDGEKVRGR